MTSVWLECSCIYQHHQLFRWGITLCKYGAWSYVARSRSMWNKDGKHSQWYYLAVTCHYYNSKQWFDKYQQLLYKESPSVKVFGACIQNDGTALMQSIEYYEQQICVRLVDQKKLHLLDKIKSQTSWIRGRGENEQRIMARVWGRKQFCDKGIQCVKLVFCHSTSIKDQFYNSTIPTSENSASGVYNIMLALCHPTSIKDLCHICMTFVHFCSLHLHFWLLVVLFCP